VFSLQSLMSLVKSCMRQILAKTPWRYYEINANDIPDHDILTGGFPCQSFSIIGKKKVLPIPEERYFSMSKEF